MVYWTRLRDYRGIETWIANAGELDLSVMSLSDHAMWFVSRNGRVLVEGETSDVDRAKELAIEDAEVLGQPHEDAE